MRVSRIFTDRDGSGRQDLDDPGIAFAVEPGDCVASTVKNVCALIQTKSFPDRGIRGHFEKSPRGAGIGKSMIVQNAAKRTLCS